MRVKLTAFKRDEIMRRHHLWRDNCPKKVAADLCLPLWTVYSFNSRYAKTVRSIEASLLVLAQSTVIKAKA